MDTAQLLRIDGEMTVTHAAARRDLLQAAVHGCAQATLELDCEAVTALDSAGIQLLLAARHSLARDGRGLCLRHVGPAVADALSVYGLQALLPGVAGEPA